MKTIIAGSRTITDYNILCAVMRDVPWEVTEVVCGLAPGVDTLGQQWAIENSLPCKEFRARWKELGKSAGYKRNVEMAKYGEALVALWDGESRGTGHMLQIAKDYKLQVHEALVKVRTPVTPKAVLRKLT